MAGREVPEIAARYNVTEAYVDRVIEQTSFAKKPKRDRSGTRWAAAICVSVVALAIFISTRNVHHEPTTQEIHADAQRVCEEKFIPARLKAPATAQFSELIVVADGASYKVTGNVDSQNGFGALVRSTFTCSVRSAGDQWVLNFAYID